jgi:hypothetical protein
MGRIKLLLLSLNPFAVAQLDVVFEYFRGKRSHLDLWHDQVRSIELFRYSPRVRTQGTSAKLEGCLSYRFAVGVQHFETTI